MHRNTYRTRLIRDGPGDRLTDPPRRIRTKLKSFTVIKFFHGLDQSEISFLDQVEEQHTAPNIAFGDTYNKS